jgi:two-component system, chemotaxis family, CheB/CheR fusion protein
MPTQKTADKKTVKSKAKKKAATTKKAAPKNDEPRKFPIVGLGASAGGLQALKVFIAHIAPNSGMAYIVVVHLTPKQPSMMAGLLQNVTSLPVKTAEDDQRIEPDHIYVVPPNKEISVCHGKIQLLDVFEKHSILPIDAFFRSLAQDQAAMAAAVVLSGTGTDGTLGVKEIKAYDGLVLVQTEDSAQYDGMPRSAINSGVTDMILPPEKMPPKLAQYFTHPVTAAQECVLGLETPKTWLNKIFAILRSQIGHDFSHYKVNTLLRRINRRMSLNQIGDRDQYIKFLREHPIEIEVLFRELLIGVTNFFREPKSFEILKTKVLPEIFDRIPEDGTFRAWVPGCSTGEEVYSLAMIMREVLDKSSRRINMQLFGTDIDNTAIDKARAGLYPASITANVSKERLKRFFVKEGDFFRIRKEVRDSAVFSVQDLIKDPPFSRLHLLSCRNLLIYLDTQAQKRLLPLFHYTLRSKGILMLGSSETIGGYSNLYDVVDNKWKIFRRLEVPQELRQQIDFPSGLSTKETGAAVVSSAVLDEPKTNIVLTAQKAILDQFAPTTLLIDAKGNILYVQGRTGKYLEPPAGLPTYNILDLARQGLRIELSSALRAAKSSNQPQIRGKVGVKTNGDVQMINLHVRPQKIPRELSGRFLVAFEDVDTEPVQKTQNKDGKDLDQDAARIDKLERELQNTRESHQTTIEELESSNEELKSTNEELQSSNEELQSTNEELESSKEELQSLNEELQTVNAELQSKVEELSAAHDDMRNLLNSTEIATIFVDNQIRVKRFTPEATTIVNLIPTDIGRPLQHVVSNLIYEEMLEDLQVVLKKLTSKQVEVRTTSGQWYKMRIIPYRTTDNRIDGAVLTFSAINEQKQAQELLKNSKNEMQQALKLVREVFDVNDDPMAVIDARDKLVIGNTAFARAMKVDECNLQGLDVSNLKGGILGEADLASKLKTAAAKKQNFQIDASGVTRADGTDGYLINGKVIQTEDDASYRIFLHFLKAC